MKRSANNAIIITISLNYKFFVESKENLRKKLVELEEKLKIKKENSRKRKERKKNKKGEK